jgi:hypothetical protein
MKPILFTHVRSLAAACVTLHLAGCGIATTPYAVSVAREIPSGVSGNISRDIISLSLPELNLAVQIQNHSPTGNTWLLFPVPLPVSPDTGPKTFGIWLYVEPKNQTFSFDPGRTTVKVGNRTLKPATFKGPGRKASPPWPWKECYPHPNGGRPSMWGTRYGIPPEGPVSLTGESCFLLWFDTKLPPETDFILSIEGIERAGEPVRINEIPYRKGKIWETEVLGPRA